VSQAEHPQEQQRSLYRRHRPRTFAEVVGQEPVVRTLRNAVQRGKVHHAYLFVGSRGTGKTSMAKILAACLNCEQGPTVEPCGQCDSCISIARASSLDVIEMDAASNNSVDDIRELRESVAYAPVSGRRKVYILDEAHMLSTAAWNAFLKTLEEPPPNTVFVLATTEANKVPATVVDRCHRFDFHRPTVEQIASVVRRAANAEAIEIPPAAVAALARSATGSFRDALGTLEQIITYSGNEIALEDVLAVLGVAEPQLLAETVDAVAAGDSARALRALETCLQQGRDAASFASQLEVRARELLLVQTLGDVPPELSLTPEADAALQEQAERVDHATVVNLLELIGAAMEAVRAGADSRTRLELALVKAARPEVDPSLRALLTRIERLEQRLPAAPRPAPPPPPPPGSASPESSPGPAPAAAVSAVPEKAPASHQPPVGTPPTAEDPGGRGAQELAAEEPATEGPATDGPATEPATEGPAADAPDAGELGAAAPGAAAGPGAGEAGTDGLTAVVSLWPAVVDLVRGENALLGALIEHAHPECVSGEDLTLAFASTAQFLKKKAEDPANRLIVGEALRSITGTRWRLSYRLREESAEEPARAPAAEHSEEEWVARFMQEFDAEEVAGEWDTAAHETAVEGERHEPRAVTNNERGA
jgi:DNA polymerase-3 subunit gamma/tau